MKNSTTMPNGLRSPVASRRPRFDTGLKVLRHLLVAAIGIHAGVAFAAAPVNPFANAECIAPAKSGGGFDVSCKLVQVMFNEAKILPQAMRTSYLLGGIGAVAFHTFVTKRPADSHALVAFSGGSLLNLAQGKFGPYSEDDVRWVAAIGMDYGVVAVRKNSPFQTLKDLVVALRANPNSVIFGAGGTIGSQDWIKSAKISRAAGVDFKLMRFVAFEGGGEAFSALDGGHVQVVAGDAAEVTQQIAAGADIRVLAVLSSKRLPGMLASVPTAAEQGYDIRWPIVRGFYVGPKVSDADYNAWVDAFSRVMAMPAYGAQLAQAGLFPQPMVGAELTSFVKRSMFDYRELAAEFKLPVSKR